MIPPTAGGQNGMSKVTCQISVSLDGYVAGPNQSLDDPLGEGGERLHEWAFATDSWRAQHGRSGGERNADAEVVDEVFANVGALHHGPQDVRRRRRGRGTSRGAAGGATTRPTTCRSSSSRTTRASRWGCRAARRSTSSPTGSSPRSSRRAPPPASKRRHDRRRREGRAAVPRGRAARRALPAHRRRSSSAAGERLLENVGDPQLEPVKVVASPAVTHVKYRVVR